jgi:hypothetical protein
MAKKKTVKKESTKIVKVTKDNAPQYLKQVQCDGFKICYVSEDGNVFTEESVCRSHALSRDIDYFKVEL